VGDGGQASRVPGERAGVLGRSERSQRGCAPNGGRSAPQFVTDLLVVGGYTPNAGTRPAAAYLRRTRWRSGRVVCSRATAARLSAQAQLRSTKSAGSVVELAQLAERGTSVAAPVLPSTGC